MHSSSTAGQQYNILRMHAIWLKLSVVLPLTVSQASDDSCTASGLLLQQLTSCRTVLAGLSPGHMCCSRIFPLNLCTGRKEGESTLMRQAGNLQHVAEDSVLCVYNQQDCQLAWARHVVLQPLTCTMGAAKPTAAASTTALANRHTFPPATTNTTVSGC